MKVVEVRDNKQQKKFINFRKKIYKNNSIYVDNNLFMIKELFSKKTSFVKNKKIYVINIEEDDEILCQGIIVYAKDLPQYIQLSFFESKPNQEKAVNLLVEKAVKIGKKYKCKKLVIGLCGHVNYGLGFLYSHYNEKNSFSATANPEYYNDYFEKMNCEKIFLNTYRTLVDYSKIQKYDSLIEKLNRNYSFKYFDKNNFDYYSKIYTDLNNKTFCKHRYYYKRNYEEDKEMLKELFLFMKEDSLIFAFDGNKPVGFVMWYPDFNELVKKGDAFGAKHFIKNKLFGKNIQSGKLMEYGILDEYRKSGLVMCLLNEVFIALKKHNIDCIKSSWILEENKDSNSVCKALCDEVHKRYVVYEKKIR